MLAAANLKLHKITSNSSKVMSAFDPEDLAKDLKDLDFGADPLPLQRSLGMIWNLESDSFCFQVSHEQKPQKEVSYQQFRASTIHWAS